MGIPPFIIPKPQAQVLGRCASVTPSALVLRQLLLCRASRRHRLSSCFFSVLFVEGPQYEAVLGPP